MEKKISIVTINWNNKNGLIKTIESVISQTYRNIEYILIDGDSTDGSTEVIEHYHSAFFYAVSEKDSGIYNAMNKGLRRATGDYIFFLNSGDYLIKNDIIENLLSSIGENDIIYGDVAIDNGGQHNNVVSTDIVYFNERYQHNIPPHPALIARRSLLLQVGGFEEEYRIIGDVVLIIKLFALPAIKYKHLNLIVSVFDITGVSSNTDNYKKIYLERRKFIMKEYPHYLSDLDKIYTSKSIIYRALNKFVAFFKK